MKPLVTEMDGRELTSRENAVLEAIVLDFVRSARPVGSGQIAKNYNVDVSSATIRNTMSDLEDLGYLSHPHTSAGRLPTDKGYRYYVDILMKSSELSREERQFIGLQIDPNAQDIEEILRKTSQVLGQLSEEFGIVLTPKFYRGVLEKLELVELASDKLLVVINIKSGIVKTVVMEVQHRIPSERLTEVTRMLNERLAGLTLQEVKQTIDERFQNSDARDDELIQLIVDNKDTVFNFADRVTIHTSGAKNIINQPEMQDPQKMSHFMELVEEGELFTQLFNELQMNEDVFIAIGSENKMMEVNEYSIIASAYQYGSVNGTVAILGPTRMYYDKIISLVRMTANIISEKFDMQL